MGTSNPRFGREVQEMEISSRRFRDVLIIEMIGKLDSVSAGDAERSVLNLITNEDRQILLDFGKLKYLTSMGMRLVIKTDALLRNNGGKLKICNANLGVKKLFWLMAFQDDIKIYDSEAEACSAFPG